MENKIDYKKLLKQEPDFKEYFEKCAFEMLKDNKEIVAFIYASYSSGLSLEQFSRYARTVMRLNND